MEEVEEESVASQPPLPQQPVEKKLEWIVPGSTPYKENRRFLAFNTIGYVVCIRQSDGQVMIRVEYHDKQTYRGFHFIDRNDFDLASLGANGVVLAQTIKDFSRLCYRCNDSWASNSDWEIDFSVGERVLLVAAGKDVVAVYTSFHYLRLYSTSGIQLGVSSFSSVVGMCAMDNLLFMAQSPTHTILYSLDTCSIQYQGMLGVSVGQIAWMGFSDHHLPALFTKEGQLHLFKADQWMPLLDLAILNSMSESSKTAPLKADAVWPIGILDDQLSYLPAHAWSPLWHNRV
jgi:chromosome transmission fidelity protein 4